MFAYSVYINLLSKNLVQLKFSGVELMAELMSVWTFGGEHNKVFNYQDFFMLPKISQKLVTELLNTDGVYCVILQKPDIMICATHDISYTDFLPKAHRAIKLASWDVVEVTISDEELKTDRNA